MHKIGRNDLCLCGSNKKYKHCCINKLTAAPASVISDSKITDALNLAARLLETGRLNDAVAMCQRILQMSPEHAATLNLLSIMAFRAGNLDVAINLLNRSVAKNPNYADAYNNLGVIYRERHAVNQAARFFEQALHINPNYVDALINYGGILQDLQRYDEALAFYRRILLIKPDHTGALSNLGNVMQELNRHAEAIEVFMKLLSIDAEYEYAYGGIVYSRMHCCDWQNFEADAKYISRKISEGKRICKPFELLPVSESAAEQFSCSKIFVQHLYPAANLNSNVSGHPVRDKIRVAYLSADFRQHPVSQLLVEVIEQHDRDRFEIFGISFGLDDQSALRHRIVNAFDRFIDVSQQSDDEIASLLRAQKIDIAIDLMGFTTNARMGIFSRKLVPVQATFLGYAGTTGADYIDYIVADNVVIPDEDIEYYSERVVRLPGCFQPGDSQREISASVPSRVAAGLPEHGFVFCAFNNHYKITPYIFDVWMRLLRQIEGSVLWLSPCTPIARENLLREAKLRGVGAERLIFAERTKGLADHLARHQLANLFLDTSPYNAHTTANDALWAGLPVLTLMGSTFAGRVAASLLSAIDLAEMVAHSLDEYEALALQLANNPAMLNSIKDKLIVEKNTSRLFNTSVYRQHLESAYICMLERQRSGDIKGGFDVI